MFTKQEILNNCLSSPSERVLSEGVAEIYEDMQYFLWRLNHGATLGNFFGK